MLNCRIFITCNFLQVEIQCKLCKSTNNRSYGIPQTIPGFPVETASIMVALPDFRKQVPPFKSVLQEIKNTSFLGFFETIRCRKSLADSNIARYGSAHGVKVA
jgi:hypothetical protein